MPSGDATDAPGGLQPMPSVESSTGGTASLRSSLFSCIAARLMAALKSGRRSLMCAACKTVGESRS
jgi:hypothetical protein